MQWAGAALSAHWNKTMNSEFRSFLIFAGLTLASIALLWWLQGPGSVRAGLFDTGLLIVEVIPQLVMGVLVAAFITVLVPREKIAAALGVESRTRGLVLATAIGSLLPGGPFASFPLVYGLFRSGADLGSLIALLVAWATVGVHRMIVWEIPFMGIEFGMLRLVSSLPLPIMAGLTARWLVNRFAVFRIEP